MKLQHFTPEQIKELQEIFGISPVQPVSDDLVKIKDGYVDVSQPVEVWWRCEDGPELVYAISHQQNIIKYPSLYSFEQPRFEQSITYLD